MKKILTMALIATLGLGGYANAANEKLETLTEVKNTNNKVKIILKEGLGKVRLAVLDVNGKKLHQQTVFVKNDIMVPYDLSELPVGQYRLNIETGSKFSTRESSSYEIERRLTKDELPLVSYRKDLNHDCIKLTVLGLDLPGVNVQIFDKNGQKVFEENINQPEAFTKIYHLKNMLAKEVTVQVMDGEGRKRVL
jgi:hypothetical protein